MRTQKRMVVCLIAGVALLAVSATAAFGSITGYSQYKDSVITLALEEENFAALANCALTLDGEAKVEATLDYVQDGPDRSMHVTGSQWGVPMETWDVTVDGVSTWFSGDDQEYYHQGMREDPPSTFLTIHADDEYQARVLNFLNVACDTVVGDLKNNFVQIGTQEGVALYQVDIGADQVPDLVSAGLSLLAVSQEGMEEDFAQAFSRDLSLENIHCTFAIDHEGRLVNTQVKLTFLGTDAQGNTHPMVIAGDVAVSDYGTAVVQPAEVGDRVLYQ